MPGTINVAVEHVEGITSKATVRTHTTLVDRGVAKGGMDRGPAGGEYLVIGLGGCFTSHLLAAIGARSAPMSKVHVDVSGTMDGTPERFTSFTIEVTAECDDDDLARKLVTIAGRGCQVVNTLRRSATVAISYAGMPIDVTDDGTAPSTIAS